VALICNSLSKGPCPSRALRRIKPGSPHARHSPEKKVRCKEQLFGQRVLNRVLFRSHNIGVVHEYPVVQERPIPKAVNDKLLVRIEAVGLNPIDCVSRFPESLIDREDYRQYPFRGSALDFGIRCCRDR